MARGDVVTKNAGGGPRVTVSFGRDEYRQISAIAAQHRVSRSWVIRHAVSLLLKQHRSGQLELPLPPSAGGDDEH